MARKAQQQQQDNGGSDLGRFAEDPAMSSVNADKFKAQMKGSDDVPETTIDHERRRATQPRSRTRRIPQRTLARDSL